jgi:hypothetical protein
MKSDEHERYRSDDQHDGLHHLGVDHGTESAENHVETSDHDQDRGARPEIEAGHRAHHDSASEQRHADLRQDIADNRHPREVRARGGIVPPLEEIGHRVNAAAQIERHEQPAEQKQDEAGEPLEMSYRESARCAGTGESDEMLAADVGSKKAGTYSKPAYISAREEIIGADGLLAAGCPKGDPERIRK